MSESSSEIDEIIKELKDSSAPPQNKSGKIIPNIPKVTDENVGDYVYDKSVEMIELAMKSIKDMQMLISTAADAKEITAYSQLLGTAFKGIENLNRINIQQKQAKNNIEMKMIESDSKTKGGGMPFLGAAKQTNNIFIGSRDEALKLLDNKKIELDSNEIIDG